ncbi:MAG: TonB-dependent receptor [Bacteroidales bacterium]|nr:TonB-dependent receptor [Bacteroidales bacterium]
MKSRVTKLCLVLFTMLFISVSAFAQKTVTGTVVDNYGDPVIGANVVVKGSQEGTMTDADGNFSLKNVSDNATLKVSFMGYTTQEVSVAGKSKINVTLEEDNQMLDEVIMVGYGVQRKSDVTGAVLRVDDKKLLNRPVANALEALQGKAAGVDITTSERPGELGSIRIRGNRSLNATNAPLYVVDGVPLQDGGISAINPADIKSMDILKDASSTAIYGSRGANGVILVTTNRGEQGQTHINYKGSFTFENIEDKSPAMTASDYITWRRWAYHNSNPSIYPRGDQPNREMDDLMFDKSDPVAYNNVMKGWASGTWDGSKVTDTDWTEFVSRTGVTQEHTLSVSGGTEKVNASASFGYLDQQGTQKGQDYRRYTFSLTGDVQAKPWFKMGGSANLSYADQEYGYSRTGQSSSSGPVDIYSAAKAIPRFGMPYDENGNIILQPCGSTTNVYTVVDEWKKSTDSREMFRLLGSFYANVDFGKIFEPLEGLTYRLSYGPDFSYRRQGIYIDSSSAVKAGSANYASWSSNRSIVWTLDNQFNYAKTFGDHNITATFVHSITRSNVETGGINHKNNMLASFLWYNMDNTYVDVTDAEKYDVRIGTDKIEYQMLSYLGRLNYSYKERYLATVSGRYDASSVLAPGHKWDFFPSMALGWRMEQEDFMQDIDWLDQFKLRWGFGSTGNAAVDPYGTYAGVYKFFLPTSNGNVPILVTNEPYYTTSRNLMPNDELGWEKTTQINYGIDFSVLGGRVGGVLDIYTSRTTDLILTRTLPSLTGYPGTVMNSGESKNFGVEVTLNAIPVKVGDFTWSTDFNFAFQKDEIVKLSSGMDEDINNAWFVGEAIGVWYGYDNAGLWQESDAEEMALFNAKGHEFSVGSVRPVDQNGDHVIDKEDRVILGQKSPKVTMGWNNTFSWKGLELSIALYSRMGYMISTGGEGQFGMYNQREIDYWRPDNTGAEWQKPIYSTAGGDAYSGLLGFKEASFIKVRNISLGYNVPAKFCKKYGLNNVKVFAQAKNLGDLYSTIDWQDLDTNKTYYNRGFTFGLQVGF